MDLGSPYKNNEGPVNNVNWNLFLIINPLLVNNQA